MLYFAHETAVIDDGALIGDETKIWHFCHVMSGATIGRQCSLGQNVFLADGAVLGDRVKVQNNVSLYSGIIIENDVFLGPSCVMTNVSNPRAQVARRDIYEPTIVRRGATIGANATIVCGVEIGQYAFVAAGSVVTKPVADYAFMIGCPARQRGWMSRHGHPLPGPDDYGIMTCPESEYRYREVQPGIVRCLDLKEDEPLPVGAATGRLPYSQFKGQR